MFHTEKEFQDHLDAHPDDYFSKGVFADWLEEQGDERAGGYRAMMACGLHGSNGLDADDYENHDASLPTCWFSELSELPKQFKMVPQDWFVLLDNPSTNSKNYTNDYSNRREAEDALARAFVKLPEDRRRELLDGKRISSLSPTSTTHSS